MNNVISRFLDYYFDDLEFVMQKILIRRVQELISSYIIVNVLT